MKMKRRDPGCWLMMTTPPQNQNFPLKTEEPNQTVNKATNTHNQNPNTIMHFSSARNRSFLVEVQVHIAN